jgi:hypothetical protein
MVAQLETLTLDAEQRKLDALLAEQQALEDEDAAPGRSLVERLRSAQRQDDMPGLIFEQRQLLFEACKQERTRLLAERTALQQQQAEHQRGYPERLSSREKRMVDLRAEMRLIEGEQAIDEGELRRFEQMLHALARRLGELG